MGPSQNGERVELVKGQILIVTLDSNPSTGYRWQVLELDPTVLQQVGQPEFTSAGSGTPGLVGRGGTESFRFQTLQPGSGSLKLGYRRSWEKGVEPVKIYAIRITVR